MNLNWGNSSGLAHPEGTELRGKNRVPLRCGVFLWRPSEGTLVRTETQDVSSDGFSCLSSEPFLPGDDLRARLEIPCGEKGESDISLVVDCHIEVLRTIANGTEQLFGLACRVNDYHVVIVHPGTLRS